MSGWQDISAIVMFKVYIVLSPDTSPSPTSAYFRQSVKNFTAIKTLKTESSSSAGLLKATKMEPEKEISKNFKQEIK